MKPVAAVGFGGTKFAQKDSKIEQELLECTANLFENVPNLSQKEIDGILVSTNDDSKYLSPILAELSGITPRISHSIENMCSSGTNAIVSGISYIASGMADLILVVGADRQDGPGHILDWDKTRGKFAHPIYWASLFAASYKRESGATDEQLAAIPAKNHRHAKDNPLANHIQDITIQDVLDSKQLTSDLKLYECSRSCTGGAAILLASKEKASALTDSPIWITGVGQKTTSAAFSKSSDFAQMPSTIAAGQDAFRMAKKEPKDIDVVELHDAFGVCEPLALEGLGFAKKNKGYQVSKELYDTQDNAVNPRGGLLGAGHPLGATGVAQTAEVISQLQQKSQKRQITDARVGVVHNMSAAATSSTVLVLES